MPWKYHLPWGNVDLQDPGLKVLIQHDVKTKELVATIGPPHIHLQQAGHVGFWPGHREKGGLTQSCPANGVAQRRESRSKPEKAALKRPLMWGQLLGMDFIEEQNLILSTPSYSLRNWNSIAPSLGHSSVKPMRKEGLWWQAPHQMTVWLTRWWFWQQHPLSSPIWHHYWLLSGSGSSTKLSVPCNMGKGVQVLGIIFYELSDEEKEKGTRSTTVFSSYLFFWCFELRQS